MSMNEILSENTTLSVKADGAPDYVVLEGLTKVPDLGGKKDKVDVTNLSDHQKRSINGLKDLGDSLEFEFNYSSAQDSAFYKLKTIEDSKKKAAIKIVLPDGLTFEIAEAEISVALDGVEVNKQLTFKLSVTPCSEMSMTAPTFSK